MSEFRKELVKKAVAVMDALTDGVAICEIIIDFVRECIEVDVCSLSIEIDSNNNMRLHAQYVEIDSDYLKKIEELVSRIKKVLGK